MTRYKTVASSITKENIAQHGPLFVYNGTSLQNEAFRRALESDTSKIPKEKVIILDVVHEADGTSHHIRHTADQIKSFYDKLSKSSRLHGMKTVAIVSHVPHFIRIPFYLKKYNDEYMKKDGNDLNFWFYGLRTRLGAKEPYIESELQKLVTYAERGHCSIEPCLFSP